MGRFELQCLEPNSRPSLSGLNGRCILPCRRRRNQDRSTRHCARPLRSAGLSHINVERLCARARRVGNNSDEKLGPMSSIRKALRRALLRNEVTAGPCRCTLGPPFKAVRNPRITGAVDIDLSKVLIGSHLVGVGGKADLIGGRPPRSRWRDAVSGTLGYRRLGSWRRCGLHGWHRKR
jgi:hypothetical protein